MLNAALKDNAGCKWRGYNNISLWAITTHIITKVA